MSEQKKFWILLVLLTISLAFAWFVRYTLDQGLIKQF